jgi:hypothetical protein
MRVLLLLGAMALFIMFRTVPANAEDAKYVKVKEPFANIYENLDPKSTVLEQAAKGDHFELVYEGTSWYQVKTNHGKIGWLERRAGAVVENKTFLSPFSIALFFILLAGTLGGVIYYIYKQKAAEA